MVIPDMLESPILPSDTSPTNISQERIPKGMYSGIRDVEASKGPIKLNLSLTGRSSKEQLTNSPKIQASAEHA